ncbi:MAG: UvrD-helicase domain-containing protein, partial [Candidatus Paceibacterota bacterium]
MQDYTEGLNEPQKEAVLHKNGPLLIVAGAGAGKTKTLTHRILQLIRSGVPAHAILAVTFTNKAAGEMKERINNLLQKEGISDNASQPFIGTFHSLGAYILRRENESAGIPKHFTILDQSDSRAFIKETIKAKNLDPKQFDPKKIQNIISRQKGECVSAEAFYADSNTGYFPRLVAEIWLEYEKKTRKEGAFDFDDLLLKTLMLLRENQAIREKYRDIWQYVHIDEYQDTNTVQYELSRVLAGKDRNICVVGDADQCFPKNTPVLQRNGEKKIENIRAGDEVMCAAGNGNICFSKVVKIRKKTHTGTVLRITTKSGKVVETTPEHIFFSRFSPEHDAYYVYLTYKKSKEFRIGVVKSAHSSEGRGGKNQVSFLARSNQEKADKMWVIKVCETKQDAIFWENYYCFSYGIPSVVFHADERKIALEKKQINELFKEIDTRKNAKRLLKETGLFFDYPHYSPQGTTRGNTENKRLKVLLTMFSDKRISALNPFGLSRVSINATDEKLKEKLEIAGFKTRKGERNDWRLEIARLDYGEAEHVARKLLKVDSGLTLNRTALLTDKGQFAFLPASSLLEKMEIPVMQNGKIIADEIRSIEKKEYRGDVYDLDVDKTHNYIVNSIPVHNCIYSWRGASIRNILHFEKDYPGAKVVLLEENYRSTHNILSAANSVIQKNKLRVPKNLFTKKTGGEKISLYEAYDESDEASFIAEKIRELAKKPFNSEEGKKNSYQDIAVLFRANYQSRALEEAMLAADVPYQVLGVKFFERKEVKDALSYLRASLNPESVVDLKRIINVPARGIGEVTLKKILAGQADALPTSTKKKVSDFKTLLGKIKETALSKKPSDTIKYILKETGMEGGLSLGGEEEQERIENLYELVSLAAKYDEQPPEEGVQKLLEDAALASDQDSLMHNKTDAPRVRLMTVHAAKGLEFETVFVTGLEDGLFPHRNFGESGESQNHKEEERRLFYVAISRAKKRLFLTYASVRTIFGSRNITVPSEFLNDIPPELTEAEE